MSVIGIDLDGTLAKYHGFQAPDHVDEPDPAMVKVVRELHNAGHILCLWTCRADYVAEDYLNQHDLHRYFEYINKSPLITDSVKPHFDILIDDRCIQWNEDTPELLANLAAFFPKNDPVNFEERDADFMSHAPVPYLAGVGKGYIEMFESAWKLACKIHNPGDKKVALLTICSHAKPYSKSFIHAAIREKLWKSGLLHKTDIIHISSAGIIPSSAEMTYPFNAYDHDGSLMSEEIKLYFFSRTADRLEYWFEHYHHHYDRIVVYLRTGSKTLLAAMEAAASVEATDKITFIAANKEKIDYPDWMALPDDDDCLVSPRNLAMLIGPVEG